MEIKVYGEHLEITPAMQEHAEKHLDKFKKMMHDCSIEIRLSSDNNKHKAKFNLHYHGHDLHVEKTGDDMYNVITQARETLLKNAKGLKEKINKNRL